MTRNRERQRQRRQRENPTRSEGDLAIQRDRHRLLSFDRVAEAPLAKVAASLKRL
jgi:hypothetical protein